MLIMGQNNSAIFSLDSTALRVRIGGAGSWLDAAGHTAAHFESKERAAEVMQEIWDKAQAGQGFYEIPRH